MQSSTTDLAYEFESTTDPRILQLDNVIASL